MDKTLLPYSLYGNVRAMNENQCATVLRTDKGERIYIAFPNASIANTRFLYMIEPCVYIDTQGKSIYITRALLDTIQAHITEVQEQNINNAILAEFLQVYNQSEVIRTIWKQSDNTDTFKELCVMWLHIHNTTTDADGNEYSLYDLRSAGTYHGTRPYKNIYQGRAEGISYFTDYRSDILDIAKQVMQLEFYLSNGIEPDRS